jgi:hypothetical protein
LAAETVRFAAITRRFAATTGRVAVKTVRFAAITGRVAVKTVRFAATTGRVAVKTVRFAAITGRFAAITGRFAAITGRFAGGFDNAANLNDDRHVQRRACALVLLAGLPASCGRIGFHVLTDGSLDASGDAATPRCVPATPFGTPTAISELNVAGAYTSTITLAPDELTAYWYSDAGGSGGAYVLWTAARPDLDSPFTNIVTMTALNVPAPEITKEPGLAPDGSLLAFISTRPPDNGSGDIFVSVPIGNTPTDVTSLNSPEQEYHPFFQLDTADFYFASNRSGLFEVYHSTYLGSGAFADPTEVTELGASGSNTDDATVASGGLVVYIRSDRPGGLGGEDIWRAERASTSDAWGPAVDETEVNSAELDTPSWISPDLCRLYLSSGRGGDPSDLYVATRTP